MPHKAVKDRPIAQTGPRAYDPFLYLALQVIKQAAFDKDMAFFHSADYHGFWFEYVQLCLPDQVQGNLLPMRLRA